MGTISHRVRWIGMLLLAGMLVLSACGSKQDGTQAESPAPQQTAGGEQAGSEQSADNEEEAAPEKEWPRSYTDARGKEVTIAAKPERIAVTTWMVTENLMALDNPPAAADTVAMMSEWASMKTYFEKYPVESLSDGHTTINLEKLLEIQPDLILATTANAEIYEQLEQIAPLIVFDSAALFSNWQDSIREVAKVTGTEDAAEKFIDEAMVQLAQARKLVEDFDQTVAFVRVLNGGMMAFSVDQLAMYYDADKGIGLTVPDGWIEKTGTISLEAFSEMNPDYIFVSGAEDRTYMDQLSQDSVWQSLAAVKADHVFEFDLSGLTGGPLATRYGVETVIEALNQ